MKVTQSTTFQAFYRSVVMVMQAAPRELRYVAILTLFAGLIPSIVVWLNKLIIDDITKILSTQTVENPVYLVTSHSSLVYSIVILIVLNLFADSVETITSFFFATLADKVQGFVELMVLDKIANFQDIALFESPDLLNIVQLTEKGVLRLKELSFRLVQTLQGFFIFVPAVLLSASLVWWVPLILFSCATPALYVDMKYRKLSWRVEETQAPIAREMNLYKMMLSGEAYAKELRLFHLQSLLLERWERLFQTMFKAMEKIRSRGSKEIFAWSLLSGLGVALPYVYIVFGVLAKKNTLGDLAYPNRVSKLVLIAPGLSGSQASQDVEEWFDRVRKAAPDAEKMTQLALDHPVHNVVMSSLQQELVVAMTKHNIERSFEWKTFEMLWAQPPTIERLGEIQTKTLFIIGTEDMKDNLHTAKLFKQVPNIRFAWIDGADHTPILTHPDEVSSLILNFLSK